MTTPRGPELNEEMKSPSWSCAKCGHTYRIPNRSIPCANGGTCDPGWICTKCNQPRLIAAGQPFVRYECSAGGLCCPPKGSPVCTPCRCAAHVLNSFESGKYADDKFGVTVLHTREGCADANDEEKSDPGITTKPNRDPGIFHGPNRDPNDWYAGCTCEACTRARTKAQDLAGVSKPKEEPKQSSYRPSFEAIYMRLALEMAKRSTCKRTNSAGELMKVGCVITSTDFRKVIAVGYNGNASGLPNGCDSDTPGACGCIHAEENAVINCDVPRETPKIVFCTHLPCVACAKRLINLGGVRLVYYLNDYRIRTSLDLFAKVGIQARPLNLTAHNILELAGKLPTGAGGGIPMDGDRVAGVSRITR